MSSAQTSLFSGIHWTVTFDGKISAQEEVKYCLTVWCGEVLDFLSNSHSFSSANESQLL